MAKASTHFIVLANRGQQAAGMDLTKLGPTFGIRPLAWGERREASHLAVIVAGEYARAKADLRERATVLDLVGDGRDESSVAASLASVGLVRMPPEKDAKSPVAALFADTAEPDEEPEDGSDVLPVDEADADTDILSEPNPK